jgi:short-subunit dehydrogenase
MNTFIKIILILFFIEIIILIYNLYCGIHKYFLINEINLYEKYGTIDNSNSYVVITGASSGQGKYFALEFAKRNFNLLLIGSKNTDNTKNIIEKLYPNCKIKIIYKDFTQAIDKDFYDDIQKEINELDMNISIFINNVAYRVGWIGYENLSNDNIIDTISVKPISYSILTKMIIPIFKKRKEYGFKSCLINISAQCMYNTHFLGNLFSPDISVPYLNVYEASNAYTFYFTNSIYKEYKNNFDILNITPGAVITQNTPYLKNTIFAIKDEKYVSNIMKLIGNVRGVTCGYWGHAISPYLINIFPFIKNNILEKVGKNIAIDFMNKKINNT